MSDAKTCMTCAFAGEVYDSREDFIDDKQNGWVCLKSNENLCDGLDPKYCATTLIFVKPEHSISLSLADSFSCNQWEAKPHE